MTARALLLVPVSLAILAVLPAPAAADGLPAVGVDAKPLSTFGGKLEYVTARAKPDTVLRERTVARGRVLRTLLLNGNFAVPAVAYDGSPSGLSADGRTLVLISPRRHFPRASTTFAVVDAKRLRLRRHTRLIADGDGEGAPRVLMLTTFDLDEYVYDALRAGASGFLLKDVPAEQLVEGIRVIAHGDALLAPSVTKRLIHEFSRAGASQRSAPASLEELTPRELEVFKLIARGMSNAEIAAELVVSETTVKTHVARVLMKLGVRDRVQAVVLAYESGVVAPGATSSE